MKEVEEKEQKYRRHLFILLACCGMVAASVGLCVNAYGVFYTPICEELGVGRAAVTFHATISGILTGVLSPVVVKMTGRHSIRKITCFGVILSASSFILMAAAENLWVLNLCGVLRGVGNSCFYMPIVTVILGNWFKKKQGTIVGMVMAFSGVSGAILSPVLTAVISSYGYRRASVFGAIVIAVIALPLCGMTLELDPADIGTRPYGEVQIPEKTQRMHKVNHFSVASPVFLILAGMTFLCVFITGLTSHLSGYAESIGIGSSLGAAMISAVMLGNILSKFTSGVLADKIGVYKAFSIMFLITLGGCILLQLTHTSGVLLIASFLFGAIYASSAVGLPSIVRHIYGDKQYGEAYSIIAMISVVAPSLSMVLIGWLYDVTGNYQIVMAVCTVFGMIALFLWIMAGRIAEKQRMV